VQDHSVYEQPHAYSTGFKYVVVNGQLTVDESKHTGIRNGKFLYGPGFPANSQTVNLPGLGNQF
jgi:N-acyl-D-amino-acid deacylase